MKKYFIILATVAVFVITMGSCKKTNTSSNSVVPVTTSELSAGDESIFDLSASAFGDGFPVISDAGEHTHDYGEVIFNEFFSPPPGYAYSYYTGLGPIFNNNSCNACHGGVGEGNPPAGGGNQLVSMLFRLSVGNSITAGPTPAPGFGGQLQNNAVAGVAPEGTVNITYTLANFTFADGTPYQLQVPAYEVQQNYTTLPAGLLISPRVAPRLIGLGFLEIMPESTILQNATTATDTNHINGKANYVFDYTTNQLELGRFGWKAEAPTIKQQLAGAYQEDMGVTNSVFPQESSYGQTQYTTYPGNPSPELPDSELIRQCILRTNFSCSRLKETELMHKLYGGRKYLILRAPNALPAIYQLLLPLRLLRMLTRSHRWQAILANTVIHPYTDMLLHDMGAGLADNRPAFLPQPGSGVHPRCGVLACCLLLTLRDSIYTTAGHELF